MSEIVERYFISLTNRLNTDKSKEYKEKYRLLMRDIINRAKKGDFENKESRKKLEKLFNSLIICAMAPNQEDILEEMMENLDIWIKEIIDTKGENKTRDDTEISKFMTPSRRSILFKKWMQNRIEMEKSSRKLAEIDAMIALLNSEKELFNKMKNSYVSPSLSSNQINRLERKRSYINSDLSYLIDMLNRNIAKKNSNK